MACGLGVWISCLPVSSWPTPKGGGPWVKHSTGCGESFSLWLPRESPSTPRPDRHRGENHWTCWPASPASPPSSFPPVQDSRSPPWCPRPTIPGTRTLSSLSNEGGPCVENQEGATIGSSSSQSELWVGCRGKTNSLRKREHKVTEKITGFAVRQSWVSPYVTK